MPTALRPPLSEQCKPLSYIHRAKRWTKGEISSYDVKQHLLFSVYLKIFFDCFSKVRLEKTAKLETGSFNSFSTKKAGFLIGTLLFLKERFKHDSHKFSK